MNNSCCKKCNRCDPCGGCTPARYDCSFNIEASPYDPETWMVTTCGMMHKVKVPKINETDTKLSTNYSNGTLVYNAERHTDIITGEQLGDIINLDYLRNVDIDPGLDGNCYELIYRKWAECGDGCRSAADKWVNFNINSEGAKQCGIRYVRGANQYGCPVYLDIPTNVDEYWWGMWRPSSAGDCWEFGYIQPERVEELPKDEDGNPMVLSQDEDGKPIYGPLQIAGSLCSKAVKFTARNADPQGRGFFVNNSVTTQEFNVVPDNDSSWRAPTCGVMIVNYCVNPINQVSGYVKEVDVTCLLDNQSWSDAAEAIDSTHSTWGQSVSGDFSESCGAAMIVPKGRTIKLHARDTGDVPSAGMAVHTGQWRVHAVKALFIPLDIQGE